MRIRLFGRYVHKSIAVLAASEAVLFYGALLLAYSVRFGTSHPVGFESGALPRPAPVVRITPRA